MRTLFSLLPRRVRRFVRRGSGGLELVIFDMDGVLRDTILVVYTALCHTVEELGGVAPPFARYCAYYSYPWLNHFRSYGVTAPIEEIEVVFRKHRAALRSYYRMFPEAADVVRQLDGHGFMMASVSADTLEQTYADLRSVGIEGRFDLILGERFDKTAALEKACLRLDVAPHRAAYVGDLASDMEHAGAAGLMRIARVYENPPLPPDARILTCEADARLHGPLTGLAEIVLDLRPRDARSRVDADKALREAGAIED
ncbi:MAG: hypothetical protein COV10_02210 [Candidatus Vogelbacteria bacterium CG10_big_fil_rev_8_21_14_0_10_51_16]|uniref:HAD family hydrolase n=1 Tax=Candidatus Vogelbacteria bacterium CG10_big_fil_rev_8_21_14_0_10_51_16 TaxID=1975045 RepID=A0A2H0REI8_9BACT|nr:MAG: hypothetical protein COV10_02210 [Candidatus Vogelbacteria bacterium CG10_big_fil_rev_8_21_14_0_10_51_16]